MHLCALQSPKMLHYLKYTKLTLPRHNRTFAVDLSAVKLVWKGLTQTRRVKWDIFALVSAAQLHHSCCADTNTFNVVSGPQQL